MIVKINDIFYIWKKNSNESIRFDNVVLMYLKFNYRIFSDLLELRWIIENESVWSYM